MGSLKEEMRSFRGDHKTYEMTGDGDHAGESDGNTAPEGPHLSASQESTCQEDYKLGQSSDAKSQISEDLSQDDRSDPMEAEDSGQAVSVPLLQQSEAEQTQKPTVILSDIDIQIPLGLSDDKAMDPVEETMLANENIPVPATPGPYELWSPAPEGQHHMRTQVSLEVVQCHSAATSPMTPAQGGNSFFFPSGIGTSVGSGDMRDAELQVGNLVELCSVATSPMTPKTPFTTAFSDFLVREGVEKNSEQQKAESKQDSVPAMKKSESETSGDSAQIPSKDLHSDSNVSPEGSASRPDAAAVATLIDPQVALRDGNQQCQQQRMGSMDQDITITVTHYNNKEEEEGDSPCFHLEQDMVKIDEYKEPDGDVSAAVQESEVEEKMSPEGQGATQTHSGKVSASCGSQAETSSNASDEQAAQVDSSAGKAAVPESPAPFGCHNIRTQVSLEVVQCQSVATSPMTPPEGDQAFCFPSLLAKSAATATESKDAESQVGRSVVECRSVATAPMTPRTPTVTTFPEVGKVPGSSGGKISEENEDKREKQEAPGKEESAVGRKVEEDGKEKCEEPVQEVSWDEKGMTWEVYGAVVEVTVLGSAIQKHLEKQVKKRQPSMPPPPPLNLSAVPLSPGESVAASGGSGKGRVGKRQERDGEAGRRRRNPFRQMMENMQQPHCCSKAHTSE